MPDQDLIGGLINTYRTLNMDIRPMQEDRLRGAKDGGATVRDVIRRFRDHELRFSQSLKDRMLGMPLTDNLEEVEMPTLGTETDNDTTAMLIAQFGTARESTLAMLREIPDPEWDSTDPGGKSVRTRVVEVLDNDKRQLERISSLLGARGS